MIELSIPAVPPSPNTYLKSHWSVYHKIRKEWFRRLADELLATRQYRYLGKCFPEVKMTIERVAPRMLDPDNLVASMKPVIDAFKVGNKLHLGIIMDDDPAHLRLTVIQSKGPEELRITLQSVV